MKTGPKWRVYGVHEAALMLAYLSREAGWRKTEPTNPKVSPQRRRQLLARGQEMAKRPRGHHDSQHPQASRLPALGPTRGAAR